MREIICECLARISLSLDQFPYLLKMKIINEITILATAKTATTIRTFLFENFFIFAITSCYSSYVQRALILLPFKTLLFQWRAQQQQQQVEGMAQNNYAH